MLNDVQVHGVLQAWDLRVSKILEDRRKESNVAYNDLVAFNIVTATLNYLMSSGAKGIIVNGLLETAREVEEYRRKVG